MLQKRIEHMTDWRDWSVELALLCFEREEPDKIRIPFGPLEVGDVLLFGADLSQPFGTAEVIGVPSTSNMRIGGRQTGPIKWWPRPPEERRTGFYRLRNLSIPFVNRIDVFDVFYTGTRISFGGHTATILRISGVRRVDGTVEEPSYRFEKMNDKERQFAIKMAEAVQAGTAIRVKVKQTD
jgi:hypothetical protein